MLTALGIAAALVSSSSFVPAAAQSDVTERELEQMSGSHEVRVRVGGERGRVRTVPLEVYVARVLAGEGEPRAADAARQALAIAIRTYAITNARRHIREGFGLCDTTHCQVLRASTAPSRAAALATAGRILTYDGSPAEVFYSASCGGRSERAWHVWPGADFPYLQSIVDDVHEDEEPWRLDLPLREVESALRRAGFAGTRLTAIEIEARNESGRVERLRLRGLRPETIGGAAFRNALGPATLRSTAFSVELRRGVVRFTGRGYGHGVGMCVVGAGLRARRGQRVDEILQAYYPGLEIAMLADLAARGLTVE